MTMLLKQAMQNAPVVGGLVLTVLVTMVLPPKYYSQMEFLLRRRDSSDPSGGPSSSVSSHSDGASAKQFANVGSSQTAVVRRNDADTGNNSDKAVAMAFLVEMGLSLAAAGLASHVLARMLKSLSNGQTGDAEDGQINSKAVKNRLLKGTLAKRAAGHKNVSIPFLTPRELQMADDILNPDDIDASFSQIGGLDQIKQEIYDLAVFPLVHPSLFVNSTLRQPPRGILLFGKPGTGKTMLAKAIAKEAEAIFLPLQLSKILNKYWGESNKLIAATFSLAHKLQPAVIFIDELDTFLKNSNSETAYMDSIKAEFLTLWDGVATSTKNSRVLVLGATNKPNDIDRAILRRMPRTFEVPLPNAEGRLAILELTLKQEDLEPLTRQYLPQLANATVGYSGSDLKELCRAASMVPIHERTAEFSRRRVMGDTDGLDDVDDDEYDMKAPMRAMSIRDLEIGLLKVSRSGEAAIQYGARENNGQHDNNNNNNRNNNNNKSRMDDMTMRQLAALMQAFMKVSNHNGATPNDDRIPNL